MRAQIAVAVTAAAAAVTLGALTAAPAQAADWDCGASQSCLWADEGFRGQLFHSLQSTLDSFGAFNGQASSLYNLQPRTLRYYSQTNEMGSSFTVASGGEFSSIGAVYAGWNDVMRSWAPA
jgi:hypothetical protein